MEQSAISWGDTVRIKGDAPEIYQPDEIASVCGITSIGTRELAARFDSPLGSLLFLVEFDDGTAIEVPVRWLEHAS